MDPSIQHSLAPACFHCFCHYCLSLHYELILVVLLNSLRIPRSHVNNFNFQAPRTYYNFLRLRRFLREDCSKNCVEFEISSLEKVSGSHFFWWNDKTKWRCAGFRREPVSVPSLSTPRPRSGGFKHFCETCNVNLNMHGEVFDIELEKLVIENWANGAEAVGHARHHFFQNQKRLLLVTEFGSSRVFFSASVRYT